MLIIEYVKLRDKSAINDFLYDRERRQWTNANVSPCNVKPTEVSQQPIDWNHNVNSH